MKVGECETENITVVLQLTEFILLSGRTVAEGLFSELPWDL